MGAANSTAWMATHSTPRFLSPSPSTWMSGWHYRSSSWAFFLNPQVRQESPLPPCSGHPSPVPCVHTFFTLICPLPTHHCHYPQGLQLSWGRGCSSTTPTLPSHAQLGTAAAVSVDSFSLHELAPRLVEKSWDIWAGRRNLPTATTVPN